MAKIFKATQSSKSAAKSLVGKTLDILIERLDINGVGVGRYHKKSVFVPNCLVGEQVKAKVVAEKSKFISAKPQKLNNLSRLREKPKCQHYYQCGGCELQHLSHQGQLEFKQQKVNELFSRQGIENLPWQAALTDDPWHYRRKARIGVQFNKLGEATVGFRQKESNTLTPIKHCDVLTKPLAGLFVLLQQAINQLAQPNSIGHIEIIDAEQPIVVIRQLTKLNDGIKQHWQQVASEHQWQVIFDTGTELLPLNEQMPTLSYAVQDLALNFTANDFIQVNARINQYMVAQAADWLALKPTDQVLDLFCGLGNFALPIAQKVQAVIGVEGVTDMVKRARINADGNHIENAQFYQLDLNSNWQQQRWSEQSFNKVLLDPARAGALEACQQLLQFNPELVLYVSCDPSSLARDAKTLLDAGYQITKIGLIDMFSQTKHVESMVLFEKTR